MTKFAFAIGFAMLSTTVAASAETYNYSCKVDGRSYLLRVDDVKNTLEWRGNKYGITNANTPDNIVCAKAGWHVEGNGTAFDFCAATQGYADIERDGIVEVECNLRRR
jgi:hypothetical protein